MPFHSASKNAMSLIQMLERSQVIKSLSRFYTTRLHRSEKREFLSLSIHNFDDELIQTPAEASRSSQDLVPSEQEFS
jgi:hypothetical protein